MAVEHVISDPPAAAAAAAAWGSSANARSILNHGDDGSLGITLGVTAQQVKKAQKQQQRNQRRHAKAATAASADDDLGHADAAGLGFSGGSAVSATFAGFEAHTSGIGSRLMASWGWVEGQGLGRARQGRPEPLQAQQRPKQLGLGA